MTRPLAVLLLAAVPMPAAAQAPAPKGPDYYPLAEGNKWEYRLDVNGMKVDVTAEVVRITMRDKLSVATVETRLGLESTREELYADARGVYRYSFNGLPGDKPVTLLRYPVAPGSWTETVKLTQNSMSFDVTVNSTQQSVVEVKVPAGVFKAVPVETTTEIAGRKVTATSWYADGVGLVKQVTKLGGTTAVMDLTRFTPGR